ncbi:MAG: hypothetical protein KBD37_00810 [Burkholderiales bacterium]|nr:hypothetical protein [Burkholderiales bacterium]
MSYVLDDKYKNHEVFSKLTNYIAFYEDFAISIMKFPTYGTTSFINLDTYAYSSIGATLESIKMILKAGQINDAFALLRKYHDSTIINIYSNLYISDHLAEGAVLVDKINNWLHGKEKMIRYEKMCEYIKKSDKLKAITELFHKDKRYETIRKKCNDHTHYNFFHNLAINDKQIYNNTRIQLLNEFLWFLQDLLIQHLAYIFYLHDHYTSSSDYIDYLEISETPPIDSQYWVASFIQGTFNSEIKLRRIDIYNEIKNKTNMHLN